MNRRSLFALIVLPLLKPFSKRRPSGKSLQLLSESLREINDKLRQLPVQFDALTAAIQRLGVRALDATGKPMSPEGLKIHRDATKRFLRDAIDRANDQSLSARQREWARADVAGLEKHLAQFHCGHCPDPEFINIVREMSETHRRVGRRTHWDARSRTLRTVTLDGRPWVIFCTCDDCPLCLDGRRA
jgi:hypothetical protein